MLDHFGSSNLVGLIQLPRQINITGATHKLHNKSRGPRKSDLCLNYCRRTRDGNLAGERRRDCVVEIHLIEHSWDRVSGKK